MLEIVVIHLDAEDDDAANGGDEIGKEKGPERIRLMQYPLQHETRASYAHHEEGGQSNAVGVTGANGPDGLWQIPQYHRDARRPTQYFK